MIGSTIIIKGEISGDEDLIIEGKVEGTVKVTSHTVTVGATGKVKANIDAKTVKIDGEVTGDILGGEKVIISKAGRVRGNIVSPRVTLEDGAQFKGSIDMDPGAGKTELPLSSVSTGGKSPQSSEPLSAKAGG